MFTTTLLAVLASTLGNLTSDGIKALVVKLVKKHPELSNVNQLLETNLPFNQVEDLLKQLEGVLSIEASSGYVEIDQAEIQALNGIKFDHQTGNISIKDAQISSKILVTGGSNNATGTTVITNSNLNSQGTSIKMTGGASIKMTGGAKIIQN